MSFNSLYFLLFLFITVLLYYIFPRKMKPFFLLAANYGFYALYNVKVLPFLIIFSVLIYIFGLLLEKHPKAVLLTLIIFLALVPLLICKYANWLISLLAKLFPTFLINETTPIFSIVLPLGISYFTFKSIGYLADVYKGTLKAETNFILLAVFISFFPEMLIGPIDRASNLLVQLKEKSLHADWNQLQLGILLLFGGYFEKMVVADRFGIIVDSVYGNLDIYTGFPVLIAICCYSLQIYFDFAGCTYMALGVGRILGFTLPENFKQPYLATSVEGFWRRWHISLTSWLRDYIYIPLVGNRKGAFRKYLNVMIVFFTSGLWHGAGINFIIWGGLNGIFQIIGTFTTKLRNYIYHFLHINENSFLSVWWKRGWTFIWMSIAWVFFGRVLFQKHCIFSKICFLHGIPILSMMVQFILLDFPS